MTRKTELFQHGESRYYIRLESCKYYVKGNVPELIETRFMEHAGNFTKKDTVKKVIDRSLPNERVTIIEETRFPLETHGAEVPEQIIGNGIETGRHYVLANFNSFIFSSSEHNSSVGNYLYAGKLFSLEDAQRIAKEKKQFALVNHGQRITWDVVEVALIEKEVTL